MLGFGDDKDKKEKEVEEVATENTPEEALSEIDTDKDGNVEVGEAVTYFIHSRTLQVNAVALIAMFVQSKYGFVISPDLQSEILLVVNMWLRTKTTKPIKWKK